MPPPPRAAIVTVGDELLLGRTVDTNAAWLGQRLAERGIPVARRATVADDDAEIRLAVSAAVEAAELVLVTGGLGPTPDDVTREAVAALTGRPLREDPEVMERILDLYRRRGLDQVPEPNRRVARVPEGAATLANPHGTAPGLALEHGGALVVLLPGVPREMRGIVEGALFPLVEARFQGRLRQVLVHMVHTTGIPESRLSQEISERLPGGAAPLRLAFLPDVRGVDLRFTAVDMTPEEAGRRFGAVEEALADVLAPWRFRAPSGDLAEALSGALRGVGATLAVAESCTGGLVSKRITDLPGASQVLVGGLVAYADAVKEQVLGVPREVLAAHGAVSEAVASAMALGVARALGARAGISITGVAGPGGGTEAKPVGTVWYAASMDGRVVTRRERFSGDRDAVRERAAQAALFLLLTLLDGRAGSTGAEPSARSVVS